MGDDVTRILSRIEAGDPSCAEQLLPLVYRELRKLAAAKMADERPGHTLEATGLVHEAYLRLVDDRQARHWNSRGHFFAAAAAAMRRILVDRARKKKSLKRGGRLQRQVADVDRLAAPAEAEQVLAIDTALEELAVQNAPVARLVELRYFAGLTLAEAATALGISERTASRYWVYAKAWLLREIRNDAGG